MLPLRLPWADLLKRAFGVEGLRCECGRHPMRVIASTTRPPVAMRIFECMGLSAGVPPLASASTSGSASDGLREVPFSRDAQHPLVQGPNSRPPAVLRVGGLGIDDALGGNRNSILEARRSRPVSTRRRASTSRHTAIRVWLLEASRRHGVDVSVSGRRRGMERRSSSRACRDPSIRGGSHWVAGWILRLVMIDPAERGPHCFSGRRSGWVPLGSLVVIGLASPPLSGLRPGSSRLLSAAAFLAWQDCMVLALCSRGRAWAQRGAVGISLRHPAHIRGAFASWAPPPSPPGIHWHLVAGSCG